MVHVYLTLLIASMDFDDILEATRSGRSLRDVEEYPDVQPERMHWIIDKYKYIGSVT